MKVFAGGSGRISDFRNIMSTFIIDYFFVPVLSGVYGFLSFLGLIITVKCAMNFLDKAAGIAPSLFDIQISAIGFILAYGLKVIRNLE